MIIFKYKYILILNVPIEEKTFKEESEKIVSKVIDTKYACCYDTLTDIE